jgi:hypothetical protein
MAARNAIEIFFIEIISSWSAVSFGSTVSDPRRQQTIVTNRLRFAKLDARSSLQGDNPRRATTTLAAIHHE